MNISILVPVYNSGNIIEESYKQFKDLGDELIFCDDGSTDNSIKILNSINDSKVTVLTNSVNKGLGFTLRRLFNEANCNIVVYFDADAFLSFDLTKFRQLVDEMDEFDAVIASRYKNADIPLRRYIPSRIYYFINRLLFGLKIEDVGSGCVIIKKSALDSITLVSDGFEIHPEIYYKLNKAGFKIKEVYVGYKHWQGGSFKILKHGPKTLFDTIRLWLKIRKV